MNSIRTVALLVTLLAPVSASANTICGSAGNALCGAGWDASAFNIITLGVLSGPATNAGNFTPSSDVGGRVAVFGNLTGNGAQIGSQGYDPDTDKFNLIANGNINTNPFTVGNGSTAGAVFVAGTHTAFNSPQPTIMNTGSDFDFAAARIALQTLSSTGLSSGATTGTPVSNGTNYVLNVTGTGIQKFNVDASYFTNQNLGFEVDTTSGASVIINIVNAGTNFTSQKGTIVKVNGSQVGHTSSGGDAVLFNIASATSVNVLNGEFTGALLAPLATYTSNQGFNGQLIVASVANIGEVHDIYYSGALPASAPEPSTWVSFLAGGALLAIGSRSYHGGKVK